MAATELEKTILKDDSNLKAYWKFEETSGTILSDAKGSNHLTATNTAILTPNGKFNRGLFTGTSSYSANITPAGNDLKPTGPFSLAWWMKTSDTGTYNMSFGTASWQNPTDTGFWIDYRNGSIGLHTADNSANTSYSAIGSGLNNGEWRHIVCVFTGITANNYMKLYVDGAYVGQIQFSRAIAFSSTSIFHFGEGMVNTYLDDAAFFSTALSADQIKELYEGRNLGELRPQTGLENLYHFNSDVLTDFSGNGRTLTKTGTVNNVAGKFSNCASATWNASNYLVGDTFNIGTSNLTIACWFKATNNPSGDYTPTLICIDNNSGVVPRAGITITKTNGYAQFFNYDAGAANVNATGNVDVCDDKWHHLVAVRDGSNTYIYVDGVVNGSGSGAAKNVSSTSKIRIGRTIDATYDLLGIAALVEEVQVMSIAKSASWVRQQYAIGRFGEL